MHDPFAEIQAPWWKRYQQRRKAAPRPPKRYTRIVAGASGFLLLVVPATHLDFLEKTAIAGLIAAVPDGLLEYWWKQRTRRESEQLMIVPGSGKSGSR